MVLKLNTAILPKEWKVYRKVPVARSPEPSPVLCVLSMALCKAMHSLKSLRRGTNELETFNTEPCNKPLKFSNCGGEHYCRSLACKV